MFYSDVILSKRGALGNIWLAAHWERRLSKAQLLRTSVEKGVGESRRAGCEGARCHPAQQYRVQPHMASEPLWRHLAQRC
jgi:hypothetical protein